MLAATDKHDSHLAYLCCFQVAVSEARLAVAVQAAEQVADNMVHRMLVELETGGNIRYLYRACSNHVVCAVTDSVACCQS